MHWYSRFAENMTDNAILRQDGFESFPKFIWNEIYVPSCVVPTQQDVTDAMMRGCFYFTTGVKIEDIRVDQHGCIIVESFNADKIVLTTDNGVILDTQHGKRAEFNPWLLLDGMTSVRSSATYVRVTLSYSRERGCGKADVQFAWTQPFWYACNTNTLSSPISDLYTHDDTFKGIIAFRCYLGVCRYVCNVYVGCPLTMCVWQGIKEDIRWHQASWAIYMDEKDMNIPTLDAT